LMFPGLTLSIGWAFTIQKEQEVTNIAAGKDNYPGAVILKQASSNFGNDPDTDVTPTHLQARNDLPAEYDSDCHQEHGNREVLKCSFGKTDNPSYTIALVGGSHSAHWLPALRKISETENIEIINYTKSGCRFSQDDTVKDDCIEWNEHLLDMVIDKNPDIVF